MTAPRAFSLWATITHSGPQEFVVIASAVAGAQAPIVLSRVAKSRQEAEELVGDLLLELGNKVRATGGTVVDVVGV